MTAFGELLREFRLNSRDARKPERQLSQARLGELLGEALGDGGVTGQTVSLWEKGRTTIHADQRRVLVGLVTVLRKQGGIQALEQADRWLMAGNYRPLNEEESRLAGLAATAGPAPRATGPAGSAFEAIGSAPAQPQLRARPAPETATSDTALAAASHWTAGLLAALRLMGDRLSGETVVAACWWLGVGLVAWGGTFPLLRWPFVDAEAARTAALIYAGTATIVPLLIGAATRPLPAVATAGEPWAVRLYVYIGAMVGFHVGTMMVVAVMLAAFYLNAGGWPRALELLASAWPLVLGYSAARQIPVNQLRAYGEVRFVRRDAVWLLYAFFGPLWAALFYFSYPWLLNTPVGLVILVAAIALVALQTRAEKKRN